MIFTHVVTKTMNRKTGPVRLSTYRSQGSCPTDCTLFNAGCYASNKGARGARTPFQVAESFGIEGNDYTALSAALDKVRAGDVVRFNVSGDYLLEDETPDMAYIEATNHAAHLDVLSYTHAWERLDPRWFHDKTRPNASCDTVEDVAKALATGWKAVIVDPDGRYPQGSKIEGRTAVTCPFEANGRQCVDCRLCVRERPSVVVFPVHGVRRRVAAEALMA